MLPDPTRSGSSRSPFTLVLLLVAAPFLGGCDGEPDGVIGGYDGPVALEPIAEGLTAPVALREAPDGTGRLFLADQAGMIRLVSPDGSLAPEPFLDLRDRMVALSSAYDERGLLGLAFHPAFETNGRFFVHYSAPLRSEGPEGFDHTAHISEFRVSPDDPERADPASERVVLQVDQPQANHNGGTIAFGEDGLLYIALGDGGGAADTGPGHAEDWYDANEGGNGQDVEANLLGSILRIAVHEDEGYGIPAGNPFVNEGGRDEIWAYGFRNPYRFSFDVQNGALLAADVGQNLWEEVNLVAAGGNYGWNVREGSHCFDADDPNAEGETCPMEGRFGEPLIDPALEYRNAGAGGLGVAVVGGFVYRGEAIPGMSGRYVFGDYTGVPGEPRGRVFTAAIARDAPWPFNELLFGDGEERVGGYVLGFGQDLSGELYVLTSGEEGPTGTTGRVHRIVPRP